VLESLVAKALRQTVRSLSLRPLTAAGEPPTISTTAASTGHVTATLPPLELAALPTTWSSYVTGELYPFLVETYLEAAELTAQAAEQAAGVTLERLTTGAAEAYLAGAKNRLVGIGDDLWNVVRDQLAEGYAAGESVHQLAARVRWTADVTEPCGLTIARSEVIPAANAASVEQLQLAFTDDECSKEWLSTADERTRKAHRKADGQRVGIHQAFDVDDEPLPYPGWPLGSPENTIQCRCSLAFVFVDDADEDDEELLLSDAEFERQHSRDADGRFVDAEDFSALTGRAVFNTISDAPRSVDDATSYYKGEGYRELNPALRGERDFDSEVGERRARQLLRALDARPLDREVGAWRGIGNGPRAFGSRWSDTASLEGVEWVDKSLGSTTLDESVTKQFASGGPYAFDQGVKMRLLLKPGVGAMRISTWVDEAEVLIGATEGLNYRVVRDYGVENNVRLLDVEVTPRD
jgi:hypothetical protein